MNKPVYLTRMQVSFTELSPNKAEHDSLSSGGIVCHSNVVIVQSLHIVQADFYSTTFLVIFLFYLKGEKWFMQKCCGLGFSDDTFSVCGEYECEWQWGTMVVVAV